MYRRFLNNDDYLGIITPEALAQLTRGNDARFIQAEESTEMSIVEYLSENYEIEKELAKGKYIAEYDRRITYPVGVHVYFEGQIHEVILVLMKTGTSSMMSVSRWSAVGSRRKPRYGSLSSILCGQSSSMKEHSIL